MTKSDVGHPIPEVEAELELNEAQIPLAHGARSNHPKKIIIHAMGEFIDQADRDYAAHEWLDKIGPCSGVQPELFGYRVPRAGCSHLRNFSRGHEDRLCFRRSIPGWRRTRAKMGRELRDFMVEYLPALRLEHGAKT